MRAEFVPAFVVIIERRKERGRIGGMYHHGSIVFGAHCPHGVELGIIDRHQLAVLIAIPHAERLMKFQTLGACLETLLQSSRLAPAPILVVDPVEIQQRERQKPPGMSLIQRGQRLFEPLARSAVEVDDRANARRIHLSQIAPDPLGRQGALAPAQMIVNVEYRISGLLDRSLLSLEHRPRMPVPKLQLTDIG